ncbi:MAG: ComF family protein, partial [Clostridia bacterium]|nr:ComF family protein [Clostridia bacterium]
FNQSELLAKEIANIKGVPLNISSLTREEKALSQHNLKFKQRFENVKGIYRAGGIPIDCQTVLLVDDIMTSGATVNECAKMLRLEGVSKIYCLSAAKTD